MPKRKRIGVDDLSEDGKRRRRLDTNEICQELYETIRNHKVDGRLICEPFIRAPKRRNLAEYYEVVSAPIDLCRVQQKIKMDEYDDVEQMTSDMELLVNNAKNYYKPDSQEYQDAIDIWNLYLETKNDMIGLTTFDDSSNTIGDYDSLSNAGSEVASDDDNHCEELFTAVMTATDDSRNLSTMFQLLPSKSKYPDYYKVITDPIDLKTIATKIQNGAYPSANELEKDLLLMVKNAKSYNEPGSQIYRDANALRRVIQAKKAEIDQRKFAPTKSSERIRAKKLLPQGQKWSTITAALKYESDADCDSLSITSTSVPASINDDTMNEEQNDSDPEDADFNPQWQLYEAVRSHTSAAGVALSDPFMRLPNRRFYPDYYQEIKHPMSLSKIKSKIKNGYYRSTIEVVDDLNTMFENAKKYNRPDSKIFKDAVKLQKIMQNKAKELVAYRKDSDTSDSDDDESEKPRKSFRRKNLSNAINYELKKARRTNNEVDVQMKKRMKILYKCLTEHVDEFGRSLIAPFMEKPSKKDYPNYYDIIKNPMDMLTIENNIKNDKYSSEEDMISDLKLIFRNCRQYNEEGSQIYLDSEALENILVEKIKELGSLSSGRGRKGRPRTSHHLKLKSLYDAIINYVDSKGRQLSNIFMKLPSKMDYPDYYDVIRRPMDLEKIGHKVKSNSYDSLGDLLSDLVLVFDNACKYNEPDSQLYKDALTLQHVALQSKLELTGNESHGIPDIKAIIQDLLTNLFISVYNHQDEEGRCYSDSIIESSEQENKEGETKVLTLDTIKRNLDKGRYRRLDRFQMDMFEVFEKTRKNSRVDSQAFEDSIELQLYFIRLRDELCRNGEILQSSALSYNENHLLANVESLKAQKLPFEQQESEIDSDSKMDERDSEGLGNSVENIKEVSLNEQLYRPGDFVYIESSRERNIEPHIINISKLWKDGTGQIWIYGCWFYRPFETYHIASKKFLEKEVFKSDSYNNAPLSQVVGKCFVMFVKDYFKFKPQGYDDRDVYVCESRYFTRTKTFKKIKVWPYVQNVTQVLRERALAMNRVPSIFKDGETKREEIEEFDELKTIDIERNNIPWDPIEGIPIEEGAIYYEQFTIPSGSFKLGDCGYVRTDRGVKNLICRIDRMWVDKEGNAFFHGPWFVQPRELPPFTPRMFYPQEVFLSSIEDTNPLLSICGKCAVLDLKDYISRRPTEIEEKDVYVCESKYLEHEKKFIKLNNVLGRTGDPKPGVIADEFFILRKPLNLIRSEYGVDKSVVVAKKSQEPYRPSVETENEESNDITPAEPPVITTPVSGIKRKLAKRLVTGYIMFASEMRKKVVQANPECNFGDCSRIIGQEWKYLSAEVKQEYEKKAQRHNEESAREAAREAEMFALSPGTGYDNAVYECHWENKCDFQCEDPSDLYDHLCSEPGGHVWKSYGELKDKEESVFQCLFRGCGRVRKGNAPFPSIARLIRHCKEVHVSKQNPKFVPPENRSKNFTPGRKSLPLASILNSNTKEINFQTTIGNIPNTNSTSSPGFSVFDNSSINVNQPLVNSSVGSNASTALNPFWVGSAPGVGVQVKPAEPLFVSGPSRPNRVLHTSTFISYIKGLRVDCKHVTNWEKQLNGNAENTVTPDKSLLPTNWLENGDLHGNATEALWALRDYMLRDALNIAR